MSSLVRYLLIAAGALVALVVIAVVVVVVKSNGALTDTYALSAESFTAPTDSASIAEGSRLAQLYGCKDCHIADLGGQMLVASRAFGNVPAPNLTAGRGGVGATYSDTDYERTIRHGLRPDGRSLVIMPSADYQLTDEDLGRIIAFLRSLAPVDREFPPLQPGPIMRMILTMAAGDLLQARMVEPTTSHTANLTPGATVEYGQYMAAGCRGCHARNYAGGPTGEPGVPPAANITPDSTTGIGSWTQADFDRAVRQGRRPDGRELVGMPWQAFSVATDDEVAAMWLFLRTVPAVQQQVER
jgi:cytochrome c2